MRTAVMALKQENPILLKWWAVILSLLTMSTTLVIWGANVDSRQKETEKKIEQYDIIFKQIFEMHSKEYKDIQKIDVDIARIQEQNAYIIKQLDKMK